jgi:hypothetical protein
MMAKRPPAKWSAKKSAKAVERPVKWPAKPPLKKRAAVKAVKAKPTNGRRKRKMTTKPYGSDDNGDKATKPAAKAVPDARLTQEQVDAGVKAAMDHDPKVVKPDELVRKTDAAMHGYTYPPAKPAAE